MRLSVKRNGGLVSQRRFRRGPIYIGRQIGSQIFLPEAIVSRQHAVIYMANGETWILEDLDSANKTYLNDKAIHKTEIKPGDIIRITDFTIEVFPDEQQIIPPQETSQMDDTIVAERSDTEILTRDPAAKGAPPIKIPAKRAKDLSIAVRKICKADSHPQLQRQLLDIILGQFSAQDAWVGLRKADSGPMECQGGRKIDRESISLTELVEKQSVADAMAKRKYMLFPQLPRQLSDGKIRSVIVAPIVRDEKCYGVIYADNTVQHKRYSLGDLDYMMLLTLHAAAVMENL